MPKQNISKFLKSQQYVRIMGHPLLLHFVAAAFMLYRRGFHKF